MDTTGIKDTHTASLYEVAFTTTRSVSGQSSEDKQRRAWLVAGWVNHALEQGRLGSCAHAWYHQYHNGVGSVWRAHVGTSLQSSVSSWMGDQGIGAGATE